MSRFLRDLLEIAAVAPPGTGDTAIVMDRSGGMRMMDATGWSMAGLVHEFGAKEAYRIGRGPEGISVEGWTSKAGSGYASMSQTPPSPGV